jgi:hypothetical protein
MSYITVMTLAAGTMPAGFMNGFIEQAAKDYDMTINEVLRVQKFCRNEEDFYNALERYVLNRKVNYED